MRVEDGAPNNIMGVKIRQKRNSKLDLKLSPYWVFVSKNGSRAAKSPFCKGDIEFIKVLKGPNE